MIHYDLRTLIGVTGLSRGIESADIAIKADNIRSYGFYYYNNYSSAHIIIIICIYVHDCTYVHMYYPCACA